MTEYRIVQDSHGVGLMNAVNQAIKEGWRPIGGVSVAMVFLDTGGFGSHLTEYAQAMIR